jgi:hypothetical protein
MRPEWRSQGCATGEGARSIRLSFGASRFYLIGHRENAHPRAYGSATGKCVIASYASYPWRAFGATAAPAVEGRLRCARSQTLNFDWKIVFDRNRNGNIDRRREVDVQYELYSWCLISEMVLEVWRYVAHPHVRIA